MGLRLILGLGDPVLVQPDRACAYILSPNQHKVRFGKRLDINKFGMRSAPVTQRVDRLGTRILIVDDSMAYGTSRVGQTEIFANLLNQELPLLLHQQVDVLNASTGGWAIANETQYIQSRGIFDSDIVLLILNAGDLTQPRSQIGSTGADLPTQKFACAWCELWSRYLKPKFFSLGPEQQDAGTEVRNDPAEAAANLKWLDEFRSVVTGGHARMGTVFIPFRNLVQDHTRQSVPDQLLAWATQRNVAMLDVTPYLTRLSSGEVTFDGEHLNALGNRIVASAFENSRDRLCIPGADIEPVAAR